MSRRFDLLTSADIDSGRATAAYYHRTEEILQHQGENPDVVAELSAPEPWQVLTGLKDAVALLEGKQVDVYAPREGTIVTKGPVLRIEGPYLEFCRYESPLLGFLSHASGISTAAADIRRVAPDSTILSFGTRRQHPALGAMIERAAIIGGADGIGNVAGGDQIGVEAGGTMPHALVLCLGSPERAWDAFDETLDEAIPRTLLVDTFGDEADEAVRAASLLGDRLDGVRLDTPSSRRGNLRDIAREVRWELDTAGFPEVEILVSGSITAEDVRELRDIVDGFGIGGAIANADPIDYSLNIVEVDGDSRAKKGVCSGAKTVFRDETTDRVIPVGETARGNKLFEQVIDNGEIRVEFDLETIRDRTQTDLRNLPASHQ